MTNSEAATSLTYEGLMRLANDAFMLGVTRVTLPTGSYPVSYEEDGAETFIDTEDGPLRVYTEKPSRKTATTRMAQVGATIIRVNLNGQLLPLGLLDGQFVENIERECAREIMA